VAIAPANFAQRRENKTVFIRPLVKRQAAMSDKALTARKNHTPALADTHPPKSQFLALRDRCPERAQELYHGNTRA
jgi:hypothetical protein